jgi:chemotaxis protein MotB
VTARESRGRAGADRWLVSYADLVTLLLACFATAFTASYADPSGVMRVAAREARAGRPPVSVEPTSRVGTQLASTLAADIAEGRVEVSATDRQVVMSLPEAASFDSGSTAIRDEAETVLARFAAVVGDSPAHVRVEGHTDDVPVHSTQFASNWELSTARAAAVVQALVARGVPPARLSAAGYGEFHPRIPNDSATARAVNRRVDIVVVLDGDDSPAPRGLVP